jgi:hypothetical protein
MQNYGNSLKYAESSMNSAGSAMKKFGLYEEGIEAKTNRIKQSFEMLSYDTVDGNSVKGILDLVNVLVKAIDKVGIFNIAWISLVTIMSVKGFSVFTNLSHYIVGSLIPALTGATTSSLALASAMTVIAPIAIISGIIGLVKLFDLLTTSLEEQREKVTSLTTELQSLQTEYETLSAKQDLTAAESKRLELLDAEIEANKIILKQEQQKLYDQEKASKASKFDRNYISSAPQDTVSEYNSLNEVNAVSRKQQDEMINRKAELISQFTTEIQTLQGYIDAGVTISDVDKKRLAQLNAIIGAYNAQTEAIQAATEAQEVGSIENMQSAVSSYVKALQTLEEVESKVKDEQSLSYDEKTKLLEQYPQLESAIYRTADGWSVEVDALNNVKKTSKELAIAQVQAEKDKTLVALQGAKQRIGILVTEATTQAQFTRALLGDIQGSSQGVKLTDEQQALQNQFNLFKQLTREADKFKAEIESIGPGGIGGSKGSKSSASGIDSQDMASAFLKAANAQSELTKFQGESLERQIKSAESAKDYAKQIKLQNQLLENQKQQIVDLGVANDKIHAEADRLRSNSSYGNMSNSWFDVNGEASAEYIKLLESFAGKTDKASKQAYESITDLFNNLYKLKQGWIDNTQEVYVLQDAINSLNTEIQSSQRDMIQNVADVEDQIVELYEKEFDKKKDALEEWYDEEKEQAEEAYNKKKQQYQDDLDAYTEYINDKKDALNDQYDENNFNSDLSEKQQELADIQAQINELSLSANSGDRVAIAQREELYKELAEKQKEIDDLTADRAKTLQEDALDDALTDYEDFIDDKQSALDEDYDQELARLDDLYQKKLEKLEENYSKEELYSKAREALLSGEYTEITALYNEFQNNQSNGWSSLGATLENEYLEKLREAARLLAELEGAGISTGSLIDAIEEGSGGSGNNGGGSSGQSHTVLGGGFEKMSTADWNKYKQNKYDYEHGINQDQAASANAALRKTYGIASDNYSYDDIKGYYAKGGAVDKTGLIAVHGTNANSETLFNSTQSKKLYELIAGNSTADIAGMMFKNIFSGVNGSTLSGIVNKFSNAIQIGNLVNIEGSIDSSNLAKVQQSTKDALNEFARKINSNNITLNKGSVL